MVFGDREKWDLSGVKTCLWSSSHSRLSVDKWINGQMAGSECFLRFLRYDASKMDRFLLFGKMP